MFDGAGQQLPVAVGLVHNAGDIAAIIQGDPVATVLQTSSIDVQARVVGRWGLDGRDLKDRSATRRQVGQKQDADLILGVPENLRWHDLALGIGDLDCPSRLDRDGRLDHVLARKGQRVVDQQAGGVVCARGVHTRRKRGGGIGEHTGERIGGDGLVIVRIVVANRQAGAGQDVVHLAAQYPQPCFVERGSGVRQTELSRDDGQALCGICQQFVLAVPALHHRLRGQRTRRVAGQQQVAAVAG